MNSGLTEQTVDNLKQVLKNYCVPDDHQFWANRMEMRHLSQHSGESFQDFSTRVISLADVCQWSNKDEQIVCSLIFGASHREAQRKALSKSKDLSVKDCIEHFVSFEATDNYHKALNINSSVFTVSIITREILMINKTLSKIVIVVENPTNDVIAQRMVIHVENVVVLITTKVYVVLKNAHQIPVVNRILNKNNLRKRFILWKLSHRKMIYTLFKELL